ncbi:MAG: hypothetical protein ACR2JY_05695 [Chloroflexota bacterium]
MANFIRHYSSVRSALVAFLVTVGAAAFGAYFQILSNQPRTAPATATAPAAAPVIHEPMFLAVFGWIANCAAILACFWFSYQTERAAAYWKKLWKWFRHDLPDYPGGFLSGGAMLKASLPGMATDLMNWLLILAAGTLLWAFQVLVPRFLTG